MVRYYKQKTNEDVRMPNAVQSVLAGNSYRRAAAAFKVYPATLQYHVKEARNPVTRPKHEPSRVFTALQESALVEHLLTAAKLYNGLTYIKARTLGYDYAVMLKRKMPKGWAERRIAGIDWLQGFLKRHPVLSLRKPQNTSLARAIDFNRDNTSLFFNNLGELRGQHRYLPDDIINLDETGLLTVMDSPKVIAQRGAHQVGQVVSAERGDLVTYTGIVTAAGRVIPPVFIFPRAKFKTQFLDSGPKMALGLATPSGWMTSDNFLKVLEHIKTHTHCGPEHRVLLIMDNRESHCSINAIEFCRSNGIDVLTLPPHCAHKMQPLDVGLFGPFKNKLKTALKDHLTASSGNRITIYDLPGFAKTAQEAVFTTVTIETAFRKTGIEPFNANIFSDEDFGASFATKRPPPIADTAVEQSDAELPSPLIMNSIMQLGEMESPPKLALAIEQKSVADRSPLISVSVKQQSARDFPPQSVDKIVQPDEVENLSPMALSANIKPLSDLPSFMKTVMDPELLPSAVSPFPKALSAAKAGREKKKSTILTKTPEIAKLKAKEEAKQSRKVKAKRCLFTKNEKTNGSKNPIKIKKTKASKNSIEEKHVIQNESVDPEVPTVDTASREKRKKKSVLPTVGSTANSARLKEKAKVCRSLKENAMRCLPKQSVKQEPNDGPRNKKIKTLKKVDEDFSRRFTRSGTVLKH